MYLIKDQCNINLDTVNHIVLSVFYIFSEIFSFLIIKKVPNYLSIRKKIVIITIFCIQNIKTNCNTKLFTIKKNFTRKNNIQNTIIIIIIIIVQLTVTITTSCF